jgi:allantoin racemase
MPALRRVRTVAAYRNSVLRLSLLALSGRTYALPALPRCRVFPQDGGSAHVRAQHDAGSIGAKFRGGKRMPGDPMRIYWPIGLTREMPGRTNRSDLFDETLNAYARAVMGPNVEVTIGWMKRTTGVMSSLYLGMINDTQIVSDIRDAERDGHAAATVGGHWDPALGAAREAAGIPVVGPGEAAMLLAGTLGRKFAFLTVMEGYVPIIENNIRTYGLEARAIARRPVRKFGMTYENIVRCLEGKDDEFLVEMAKTARECIADGADVIIAGGQLFGPILQKHKFFTIPNTGVPVVEVSACGLKLAQTLAELQRTVSLRKSEHVNAPFRTPPQEVVDEMRRKFAIV